MLVIVHDRYVQLFFQTLLYLETFRSLYVFQIDAAERGSYRLYRFDEFVRVFFIDFDVEYIDAGIDFKEQSLAFHYRLSAHCADVAQAQYGRSV